MAGSLSELCRCLNPLPSPALVETGRISQVPGQPLREHALLFDPGGPNASGHYDALGVAFRSVDDVGSTISHISRFNHTACSLAVYASRLGLLRSHHARLASRWRPTLAGPDLNPLGCFRRFLFRNVISHYFDPPSPSFCWRTNHRDAIALAMKPAARLPG